MKALRHLQTQAREILQTAAQSTDEAGDVVLQRLPKQLSDLVLVLASDAALTVPYSRLQRTLGRALTALADADRSRSLIGSPLQSLSRFVTGQGLSDGVIHASEAQHAEAHLRRSGQLAAASVVAQLVRLRDVEPANSDKLAAPTTSMLLSDQASPRVRLAITPEGDSRYRFDFDSVVVHGTMNARGLLTARTRGSVPGLDPIVLVSMDAAKRAVLLAHLPACGFPAESYTFRW